jgi:integrase
MLRLAEEWGYIAKVPKIRLAKEPEGRIRFLSEEEIARLPAACEVRQSKSLWLLPVVTIAVNTGMRKGEILGLEWERVNFSRGVVLLEKTKSGRRREIPMNQAAYDASHRCQASRRMGSSSGRRTEPPGATFGPPSSGCVARRGSRISGFTTSDTRMPPGWSCGAGASKRSRSSWGTASSP